MRATGHQRSRRSRLVTQSRLAVHCEAGRDEVVAERGPRQSASVEYRRVSRSLSAVDALYVVKRRATRLCIDGEEDAGAAAPYSTGNVGADHRGNVRAAGKFSEPYRRPPNAAHDDGSGSSPAILQSVLPAENRVRVLLSE